MTNLVGGILAALGGIGLALGLLFAFADDDPSGFAMAGGGLFALCAGLGLNALADIRKSLQSLLQYMAEE